MVILLRGILSTRNTTQNPDITTGRLEKQDNANRFGEIRGSYNRGGYFPVYVWHNSVPVTTHIHTHHYKHGAARFLETEQVLCVHQRQWSAQSVGHRDAGAQVRLYPQFADQCTVYIADLGNFGCSGMSTHIHIHTC